MRAGAASGLAGWVFADLLLALALIFMGFGSVVARESGPPPPPPPPPPTLVSLTLNPATIAGGNPVTATITLSGVPDGKSPLKVALTSSNLRVGAVPPTLDMSLTQSNASVVSTSPVTSDTQLTLSASLGGVTRSAVLTVTAPPPTNLISLDSICRSIHVDGSPPFNEVSRQVMISRLRERLRDLAAPGGPRAKFVLTFGVTADSNSGAALSAYVNDLLKTAELRNTLGDLLQEGEGLRTRNYWTGIGPGDIPGDVRMEFFVQSKTGASAPDSEKVCR